VKNTAYVNEDIDPTLVIRRLKNEIGRLREEVAFLKGEAGEGETLSDDDLAELKQRCAHSTY
jgi:kinesin family protein 6/9